jgi:hypothetical protein
MTWDDDPRPGQAFMNSGRKRLACIGVPMCDYHSLWPHIYGEF